MDVGPGAFVFSSGLMAGLRAERLESRHTKSSSATGSSGAKERKLAGLWCSEAEETLGGRLRHSLSTVGVLLVLGVVRLALTKAVEYQVCLEGWQGS